MFSFLCKYQHFKDSLHCKRFVRENPWKKQCPLVHRDFDRSYSCHKQYWQKQAFLFSYILQVLSISVKNTVKDRILIQSSDLNFPDLTMNFSWKSKLIYLHFALKYPDISRKFVSKILKRLANEMEFVPCVVYWRLLIS